MAVSGSETATTANRQTVVSRRQRRRSSGNSTASGSSGSSSGGSSFGDATKRSSMKRRIPGCSAGGAMETKWLVDYRRKQAQLSANSLLRLQSLIDSSITSSNSNHELLKKEGNVNDNDNGDNNQQSRNNSSLDRDPTSSDPSKTPASDGAALDSSSRRRSSDPMTNDSDHSINLQQIFKESDHQQYGLDNPLTTTKASNYERFSISVTISDHHEKIRFLLRNPEVVKAVRRALQLRQEEEQQRQEQANVNASNNNVNNNVTKIPKMLRREIKCFIPQDRFQLPQMQAIRQSEPRLSGGSAAAAAAATAAAASGSNKNSHHKSAKQQHNSSSMHQHRQSTSHLNAILHCIAEDYNEASTSEVYDAASMASASSRRNGPGHASKLSSHCSSCSSFAQDSLGSENDLEQDDNNVSAPSRDLNDKVQDEQRDEPSRRTNNYNSFNVARSIAELEASQEGAGTVVSGNAKKHVQSRHGQAIGSCQETLSDDDADVEEETDAASSIATSTVHSSIASSTVHGSIASSTMQSSVAESTVADTVAAVVASLLKDGEEEDDEDDDDQEENHTERLNDESQYTEFDDATECADDDDDLTECQPDYDTGFGYDNTEHGEEWDDDYTEVLDDETEVGGVDNVDVDVYNEADIRDEAEKTAGNLGAQVIESDDESEREEPRTDGEDSCLTNNTDDSSRHNLNYGLSVYLSNHGPQRQLSSKLGKKTDEDSRTSITESVTTVSRSMDESNQTSNTNKTGSSKGTFSSYRTSSSHLTTKTNRTTNSAPSALLRVDSRSSLCSSKSELDSSVHSRYSLTMEDLSRQTRASSAPNMEGGSVRSRRRLSLMLGEASRATEASASSLLSGSEADDSTVGSAADCRRRRPMPRRSRSGVDLNQAHSLRGGRRRGPPSGIGVDGSGLIPRSNTPMGTLLRTRSGDLTSRSKTSDGRPRLPPRLKSNENSSMDDSLSRRTPARSRSMLGPSSNGIDRSRGINRARSGRRDSFLGGSKIKKWDSSAANKSGHGLSMLERHLNDESAKAKQRTKRGKRPSASSRSHQHRSIASLSVPSLL